MWTQLPPEKRAHPSHPIVAHVYCGQMAGWMKTPLIGTEVDLGPGHIVLDGVPASAKGAQQPLPLFGPCLLWPRSPISATAELLFINNGAWQTDWRTDRRTYYCYISRALHSCATPIRDKNIITRGNRHLATHSVMTIRRPSATPTSRLLCNDVSF